jgi:hypothetical protein
VKRVAFDLDRPSHVAFDQQADCRPVVNHRRCIIERLARNDLFRSADIGHDLFLRLLDAALHPRQGQRSAHELQELPAGRAVLEPIGVFGKLAPQGGGERITVGQFREAPPMRRLADALCHRVRWVLHGRQF